MTTAAVVLAAGGGRRYDGQGPKLLAQFRGRALYLWALDAALGSGCDEVLVVTGGAALSLPESVVEVPNPAWQSGQASSLAAGVDAAAARGHAAVVIGLADQPLVGADDWRAVAGAVTDRPIVVARYGTVLAPPARLDREIWAELPRTGDQGARAFWSGHRDAVLEVACPGNPADVDTVEDLRRWS